MTLSPETVLPSAPEVIDVETLLAPIAGDNPAGINTEFTGLHDQIREARREEENLEQGIWKREIKVADWSLVIRLSTEALSKQTKDLNICVWLSEPLVKLHGYVGLRDGLRLMRGLMERFWDSMYPNVEETDGEDEDALDKDDGEEGRLIARANALAWMGQKVVDRMKETLISLSPSKNYSYFEWEQAIHNNDLNGIEEIEKAKNSTPAAFYERAAHTLGECEDEFRALDLIIDEKFGDHAPSLGALKKTIEDVRSLISTSANGKPAAKRDSVIPQKQSTTNNQVVRPGETAMRDYQVGGELTAPGPVGPVRSRQEALGRLYVAAEYFRNAEPHSPISYLVERAIRWSDMPLEAWLKDVIKEDSVLNHLRETLGIKEKTG
jgi:type VI secretion system protein ImpA